MNNFVKTAKAVMVGHAIGDALGVPVEFLSREDLKENPVKEMLGYGTYPVPKGAWSDDTSMSLCALASLANGGIDFDEVMLNFGKWYYKDEFTPTGEMFDVGNTCSIAIDNYFVNKLPYTKCGETREYANGNGSLMRIHPFVLYLANMNINEDDKVKIVEMASALTHAHERSKMACGIYAFVLWELLNDPTKSSIVVGLNRARKYYKGYAEYETYNSKLFKAIGNLDSLIDTGKPQVGEDEIKSGGYVVHTLEAVIWCLLTTNSFSECVLKAVNLGDDTDTVAAIAGGLAGALYGYEDIPNEWKCNLIKFEEIEKMCEVVYE